MQRVCPIRRWERYRGRKSDLSHAVGSDTALDPVASASVSSVSLDICSTSMPGPIAFVETNTSTKPYLHFMFAFLQRTQVSSFKLINLGIFFLRKLVEHK